MGTVMIILICVDILLTAGIITYAVIMTINSKKVLPAKSFEEDDEPEVIETVIEELVIKNNIVTEGEEEENEHVIDAEDIDKIFSMIEQINQKTEKVQVIEESVVEGTDVDVAEDESTESSEAAKRIPFAEKLLSFDDSVQSYYAGIDNLFRSMRKINPRISTRSVSYRLGRELVAKLTIRGKTMRLHLALDVNAFPQNVYFQKDLSETKSYIDVPFTVKVKSERGYKNAIKLIEAMIEQKGIERKTRFVEVDSLANLKEIAN